ncbi:hypothetical protein PHLGIDRAFT_161391 [Phlebiopsis gigantea 11061_1 CR5-6]|uniref:Uncharacterized protein n=1 Tax=Phlebiopsis gigantea (strain 11061_1 CR5-6) TaxID=745531 RepID=A0A0C3RVJ5_PHLG1|nr:hypothetical protein PHLGIDRAFT_161391 [Phlebiopsis gigantea 11061_1 CR5-6]
MNSMSISFNHLRTPSEIIMPSWRISIPPASLPKPSKRGIQTTGAITSPTPALSPPLSLALAPPCCRPNQECANMSGISANRPLVTLMKMHRPRCGPTSCATKTGLSGPSANSRAYYLHAQMFIAARAVQEVLVLRLLVARVYSISAMYCRVGNADYFPTDRLRHALRK